MTALRIAWFSELASHGSQSVSAHCSRLLLPELAGRHSIEVFSDSFATSESGLPHHHYLNAHRRHIDHPFDIFFYQLEDSKASRFVRVHIGLMPGVTWFHDFFFNDLGPEACHTSPWETTVRQFHDHEEPFIDRSVAPHQLWPRGYREASLSPVALFSSRWARNEFATMVSNRLESFSGGHVAEVLPIPVVESLSLGTDSPEVLRVASTSLPGIEGRGHKLFSALAQLKMPWRLKWMVDGAETSAAVCLAREFGVENHVEVISPRTWDGWARIVQESDVAVHLHTSPFGHLGPYVQTSLVSGTPTVVSFAAQGEDFPAEVVFHVIPGMHESAQLVGIFEGVRLNGRRRYGAAGRRYSSETANVKTIAKSLSDRLIEWAPRVAPVMKRWECLQGRARKAVVSEVQQLVDGEPLPKISPFERVLQGSLSELGWSVDEKTSCSK